MNLNKLHKLLQDSRDLIDGAVITHIYDTSNGDTIDAECGYHAMLRELDEAMLEWAGTNLADVYELTLPGFDGGTDATDDRVLWVWAGGAMHDELSELCSTHGATLVPGTLPHVREHDAVDYWLPMDREAFTKLLSDAAPVKLFKVAIHYRGTDAHLHPRAPKFEPYETTVRAHTSVEATALARKEFWEQAWSGQKTITQVDISFDPAEAA